MKKDGLRLADPQDINCRRYFGKFIGCAKLVKDINVFRNFWSHSSKKKDKFCNKSFQMKIIPLNLEAQNIENPPIHYLWNFDAIIIDDKQYSRGFGGSICYTAVFCKHRSWFYEKYFARLPSKGNHKVLSTDDHMPRGQPR